MKKNLIIEALEFISDRNGEYKKVELRDFLLENFEDKPEFEDRSAMSSFLKFLKKSEFIEYWDENGISIIIEAGQPIPRKEISVHAKITSTGYELLRETNKAKINNAGIISSIIFGTLGIAFAFWGVWSNLSQNKLEEKIDILRKENYELKVEIIKEKLKTKDVLIKSPKATKIKPAHNSGLKQ